MARLVAFSLVVLVMFVGAFAWVTATRTRPTPPPQRDDGFTGVPVGTKGARVRNTMTAPGDMRLASLLRSALTTAEAMRAEQGSYPVDLKRHMQDRPANVDVHVITSAENGIRISAVNRQAGRQCDIFSGDSSRFAYGYAYDPRIPACGKMR